MHVGTTSVKVNLIEKRDSVETYFFPTWLVS